MFEIGGTCITLPNADTLVIGRLSKVANDPQPDVNLNAYGADICGVSRQHIKLIRRGDLTYVTDMGSSNGTFLNGRPITHQRERVLRNGDELQLGYLKVKVRF
jgi:pSer/pThr/pTyr-binding forkhead associated (FHA) protein